MVIYETKQQFFEISLEVIILCWVTGNGYIKGYKPNLSFAKFSIDAYMHLSLIDIKQKLESAIRRDPDLIEVTDKT